MTPDDKVTVKAKEGTQRMISEIVERTSQDVPSWLTFDEKALAGMIVRTPSRDEIPTVADEQLIVEYYSK